MLNAVCVRLLIELAMAQRQMSISILNLSIHKSKERGGKVNKMSRCSFPFISVFELCKYTFISVFFSV